MSSIQSEPHRPVERIAIWASPARGDQTVRCSMRRSAAPCRTAAVATGRATGDMSVLARRGMREHILRDSSEYIYTHVLYVFYALPELTIIITLHIIKKCTLFT